MTPPGRSTAREMALAISQCQTRQTVTTIPASTWTQVCIMDPRRVMLWIGPGPGVLAPIGIAAEPISIPGGYGFLGINVREIKFRDAPAQCTGDWYAFCASQADILVIEELYTGG